LKGIFEDMCAILIEHRHVSVARRSYGHGAVEKYNRGISQLVAKMCPSDIVDAQWPWVLPSAVEAHNAALHSPNAVGSIAVSPTEMMYGVPPVLSVMGDKEAELQFGNMRPGSVEHLRRVHAARKKAIEHVNEARKKYVKQLTDNFQNMVRADRGFIQGQIVRVTERRDPAQRKANKFKETKTAKQVVIKSEGYGRYMLQEQGDPESDITERHVDDIHKESSSPEEREAAEEQAEQAAQHLIEWVVEEITAERGSLAKKTKECFVK
jgi:hypothetical protein